MLKCKIKAMYFCILLPCATLLQPGATARAETLLIQADLWCPVNCEPGSPQPGFLVELATQIFAEANIKVDYVLSSWPHAIEDVRQGETGALVGAGKRDAPDFLYGAMPAAISRQCFYARAGSTWRYTGITSLQSIRLGVINNYSYGTEIDAYVRQHKKDAHLQIASGTYALTSNVRKVELGRIDATIENTWVMSKYLAEHNTAADLIEVGCRSTNDPIYLAFSPVLPESPRYRDIFDAGLRRYQQNGRLERIMHRYGLSDD